MVAALFDVGTAVRVARELAAEHGVVAAAPVVLSVGANTLVHLAPAPVVARVAELTGVVRHDIAAIFAKDVAIAGHLAARGAPVVPPSGELPPGPHRRAGLTVSFWRYVSHDPDYAHRPADVGPMLAELHAELRGFPGALPDVPPLDVASIAGHLAGQGWADLSGAGADLLGDAELALSRLAAVVELAGPAVPLHGDAHPGNLLQTPDGPLWTDFEDAWRGPVGWDLACVRNSGRLDGSSAVAAYPGPAVDPAVLAAIMEARFVQGIAWALMSASAFPPRRADALRRLAAWRADHHRTP